MDRGIDGQKEAEGKMDRMDRGKDGQSERWIEGGMETGSDGQMEE